jgi:hypothetical protein
MKKVSSAFLKKSAQKTFAKWARAGGTACGRILQIFFGSFFRKRRSFFREVSPA